MEKPVTKGYVIREDRHKLEGKEEGTDGGKMQKNRRRRIGKDRRKVGKGKTAENKERRGGGKTEK